MAQQDVVHTLHEPLNEARNEIRLLEILQPDPMHGDVLHCRLSTCSLDDGPKYTALSYVWGDPHQTRPIVINGKEVNVTTNLADALLQLRADQVGSLWADALCINQQDDDEKGRQVQKMRDIYKNANGVIAWLGPRDEKSQRGIQKMKELARVAELAGLQNIFSPGLSYTSHQQDDLMRSTYKLIFNSSFEFVEGDIGLVIALMEKHYWTRLWVLQEISLAKHVTLFCGPDKVHWNDTEKTMAVLRLFRLYFVNPPIGFEDFGTRLCSLYKPFEPKEWGPPPAVWLSPSVNIKDNISLTYLLDLTCNDTKLECLDPRDRIYALLGLLSKTNRGCTTVDYSRSHVELFAQTTLFMLQQDGPGALLYAGLASRERKDDGSDLPSWAVDWCYTRRRAERLLRCLQWKKLDFTVRVLEDYGIGVSATSAAEVIEVIPFPNDLRYIVEKFEEAQCQHDLGRSEGKSLPVPTLKEKIWRTLLYRAWGGPLNGDEVKELFENCVRSPTPAVASNCHGYDDGTKNLRAPEEAIRSFEQILWNNEPRNLFLTADGMIGSGPSCTQLGDVVHAISGLDVPVLLRADHNSKDYQRWKLIGLAYVDDMISVGEDVRFTLQEFWATNPKIKEVILT